jgi:prepilin-type N-terminal cleavage/methylation domain-containing protein
MNEMKNIKGFTIIEILAALFVGLILLGAVYISMVSGQKSSVSIERKTVAHQDARAVLEIMATEISMASFNPNFASNVWRNPGDCVNISANQAYKGIQGATANSIISEMDILESSVVGDSPNEIISYVYDFANERVTREANCGGAQPFLGDVPGNARSVRVINNTLGIPMLRYFDGLGNEIAAGTLPATIPNIRRIEITLAVETEEVTPDTGTRRRMIYSTSVIPRNHAILQ